MKTIKLLLLSLCLMILSCDRSTEQNYALEKEQSLHSNAMMARNNAVIRLYEQIVELDDTTEQLVVASALSPQEIHELWLVKLDNYRANAELTLKQSNFLTNLAASLSPQIFIENSEARNAFDFDGQTLEAQSFLEKMKDGTY